MGRAAIEFVGGYYGLVRRRLQLFLGVDQLGRIEVIQRLPRGNRVSGGKRIGKSKTTPSANRAAAAFRMAAQSLNASQSALGGFFRRQKARLGGPKAVTAAAHKLAKIFYSMLKNKSAYDAPDANYYEEQYRKRVLVNLRKRAAQMGFELVERSADDAQPCPA